MAAYIYEGLLTPTLFQKLVQQTSDTLSHPQIQTQLLSSRCSKKERLFYRDNSLFCGVFHLSVQYLAQVQTT